MKHGSRGVLQSAREGASHAVWIQEGLRVLLAEPGAERAGIWLEASPPPAPRADLPLAFQGEVRESGYRGGTDQWRSLSLESPVPLEFLSTGKTAEFQNTEDSTAPILGPAMGMRRGAWVPVSVRSVLRGVILVAAQRREVSPPRAAAEDLAVELSLALEWEDLYGRAEERRVDLELTLRVQGELASGAACRPLLQMIAESCTLPQASHGPGASFALLGRPQAGGSVCEPAAARAAERLEILAGSGESAWAHSAQEGPLEMFWRQAVETGQATGAEANTLPLARGIARIVALPLTQDRAAPGVLMAGLPYESTNLETIERLERRALLAAQVLRQQAVLEEREQMEVWRQALFVASDKPALLLDRQGFVRSASRGAEQLMSSGPAAPAARWDRPTIRFAELFQPKDWERAHLWLRLDEPGEAQQGQRERLKARLENGVEVTCQPMNLATGAYLGVTLGREPEVSQERSREDVECELRETVGWMEGGVVVFDEAGHIRAANERFHGMLGIPAHEVAGAKTFEDLLRLASPHARDPVRFEREWRALAESSQGETQEELQMNWPVPQTLERCTREIVRENGRRLGRVEVYREMTARRMFQSRMAQTEKLASLGQRVSGIIHDMSNPLTTILGYAQRLMPRVAASSPGMQREVRGILGEAERAAQILRQLLRIAGDGPGIREPLSLNELVDRTVDVMRASLFGSPIRLLVDKEPSLPRIEGDFGQLQQVLLNLLQNAQQAIEQSAKGGMMGVRTSSAGEDRVRLEVWDDGPGIPGAIQARIFDPFFTTKPPGVGTGLGLAIVLGYVRQHGGTVSLRSSPQAGTRFFVELPALRPAAARPAPVPEMLRYAPRLPMPGRERPGEQRAAKVLVVEDEPTVGGLIADVLRDEGMRVDVLRDGHAALARAEHETYDLVICDLKMPGMDGRKFFQSLGQRHNSLREHVLFVTGDVVTPGTQEFLDRHNLPYVAKPFRVEELSRAVREML
ncbi:MAG TPA: ATP-binding protein [Candidatus Eisenbacteria bacterium]|nr:ATP-binding protein [Candidatus Eisenbacteria bacterium]